MGLLYREILGTRMSISLNHVALILLISIIVSLALPATAFAAPVDVTVNSTTVVLNMHLVLQENVTNKIPLTHVSVGYSNSSATLSQISQPIAKAIQRLEPSAKISSLQFDTGTVNSTGMYFLRENYTITVVGANTNLGSSINANLAFLAMNVSDTINIASVEFNQVGPAYLLADLAAQPPTATQYFINGHQTLNAVIPGQTTIAFRILDFSWVPAISTWQSQSDVLNQKTVWTYSQPGPQYNLTFGRKSPEGPLLRTWTAVYNPSIQVTVFSNAYARGTMVVFDQPSPAEVTMPVIVGVSLVALAGTVFLDRRLNRAYRIRKKRS